MKASEAYSIKEELDTFIKENQVTVDQLTEFAGSDPVTS